MPKVRRSYYDTDTMPWQVGMNLGIFCGSRGCRDIPGAYSLYCTTHDHRPLWRKRASTITGGLSRDLTWD